MTGIIALLMVVGASSSMAAPAFESIRADASASTTDVTTSNVWWDLCLLYNGGTVNGFNPFSKCLRGDRRFESFQYIGAKPYREDLYLYFYFDNKNTDGFAYDPAALLYAADVSTVYSASGSVGGCTSEPKALSMVGTPYNVGTQYLTKYKVAGVFAGAGSGSSFDFTVGSFGINAAGGYVDLYDVNEEMSFTYTDDQFDITAQIWGNKTTTVALTHEAAPIMFLKTNDPLIDDKVLGPAWFTSPTDGYYELHWLFFDLDRTPDQIIGLDVYYNEVTFYKVAASEFYTVYADPGFHLLTYLPPVGESDGAFDASKDKYETVAKSTRAYSYDTDELGNYTSVHTFDPVTTGQTWMPPFQLKYTHHIPQIVSVGTPQIEDDSARSWIRDNAKKADGTSYSYGVLIEQTERQWKGVDHVDGNEWIPFYGKTTYSKAECHTLQGIITGKMTVICDGKTLQWNTFSQAVNGYPGTVAPSHSITVQEMLVKLIKTVAPFGIAVIMAIWAIFWVAVCLLVGWAFVTGGGSSSSVRVHQSAPKKKG